MAHVPHWPELYVCTDCHAVYAGHERAESEQSGFDPPQQCKACGHDQFIEIEQVTSPV